MDLTTYLIIVGSLFFVALLLGGHTARRWTRARRDAAALEEKRRLGQHLARSLHPVIDPNVCIGSLSCLKACPEGDILGVVDGAAKLVHADHCIGHGRCAEECPVNAIRLVFGSAERGVDLPEVSEVFESSRRGVHLVGELGGMGLIKNAITQGLQVADHLASKVPKGGPGVVVVGAGPAGIATSLGLKVRGIPFHLVDQDTMGGSVTHYPRRKLAMTETVDLPMWGKFGRKTISKEDLLDTWERILGKAGIEVEEGTKVVGIEGNDGAFKVQRERGDAIPAAKVVLAIGRRGTPRRLGVPGEHLAKVVYRLSDPEQYQDQRVLVVGGGDAALEAAIQLAEESTAEVALSYRGAELARCREANRLKFTALSEAGRIHPFLPSQVLEVRAKDVRLQFGEQQAVLPNDFVIVNIGGELPLEFLSKVGVNLRRYRGEAPGEVREGGDARERRRSASRAAERRERVRRRIFRTLYLLVGASILGYLGWVGRDYYLLSRAARRASPLNLTLRSAGIWGHGVGIGATAFMLSNFLYAARKRWKRLGALGGIRGWLDFHVFVGFMSPLVIAFHAAFQSNNLLASSTYYSLCIVVGTGIIGRFIYGTVPSDGGKAMELADLQARFERLREEQGESLALAGTAAKALLDRATAPIHAGSMALLFVLMPLEALVLRLRLIWVRRHFPTRSAYLEFRRSVVALARIRWQIRFYASLKRLLRGWRAFHATLAVFLVLAIAAHIGVSLYLGYGLLRFK
ncbi:MAG TPA: NAD(P)-binding domain-containing protein [Anaeromyxobacter sp.]|nr:NAD(P)-binding domain-containing protein [Anaeromyxobacter sp.]